ncbi:reverse transcriptase domain-containing protein [Tanacetum coccineum]
MGELLPITVSTFTARTPKNTPLTNHASSSANPDTLISSAFMETNYEVLESLLRKRMKKMRNEDLRIELDCYCEEYDEERVMEPRPARVMESTLVLRTGSPRAQRQRVRVVEFKDAPNRDGSRVKREPKARRPSEQKGEDSKNHGVNLPLLLAAHLGRNKNGQPLQSTLTSVYGGHQPSTNLGGNLPPNGMLLSYNDLPFIPNGLQPSNIHVPTYLNPYPQPNDGMSYGPPPSYSFHAQGGNPSFGGGPAYHPDGLCLAGPDKHLWPHSQWVHARSLVEFISMDLPTIYKGLMEKTYTWIEAKEDNSKGKKKNKDRFSPYKGSNHRLLFNLSKSPREILATKKAAKAFKQPPRMVRSRKSRVMSKYCHFYEDHRHDTNQCRELRHQIKEAKKRDKDIVPAEAPILVISRESHIPKRKSVEELVNEIGEITFPLVSGSSSSFDHVIIKIHIFGRQVNRAYMDSDSSCKVIYEHCFLKLKPSIKVLRVDLKTSLVVSLENILGLSKRTAMQKMGIVVSTIHPAIKFHTPCGIGTVPSTYESNNVEEGQKKVEETISDVTKDVLSYVDAEERIIVNEKTIKVGGKPFNTENKLNEYKPFKLVKQKKRGLVTDRNEAACKEVDELMRTGILQKVKDQTWVAKSVMGIRDNPSKAKAVTNLEPPRTLRDVHSLNGKLAALKDKKREIKKLGATKEGSKLENIWKLYTNGASSSDGSSAGLMLVSPKGKEYMYALRFVFETINNEVEYEALLAGLGIAKEMEIKNLAIYVDS